MTKRNKQNRRSFLKQGLTLGAGAFALGSPLLPHLSGVARASENADPDFVPKDHYFIFYQFPGGWDHLLSWDPRDPSVFTPALVGETGIQLAYERLETVPSHGIYVDTNLGPLGGYVGDLRLPKYTDRMCLIRGLNMETLSHQAGMLRSLTGRMPLGIIPTRDSTDSVMAKLLGANNVIPNIALRGPTSINQHGPATASPLSASGTSAFLSTLQRSNALASGLEGEIAALLAQQHNCGGVHSVYKSQAHSVSSSVQGILSSDLATLFDFSANTTFAQEIRAAYGFSSSQLKGVQACTALAEQALVNQLSRCISIAVPGPYHNGFDTHGTLEQGVEQMAAYDSIARLMDRLEVQEYPDSSGDSWLDRTTIVCLSEFSRSPMLEDDEGRGHWLANSMVLLGGGIKGNQVIGQTLDVGMLPMRTELISGQVCEAGQTITPDNVLRALYDMLGYTWDVADLRVDPLSAILPSV